MSPRRNLKKLQDGKRRTEQSGINLKNTELQPAKMSSKHLCTSRPAGREIDRQYAQGVEENNKRYQENPQLYRTRQEINEHIFGIKDNGVTITLI
jgi:hypothetical protein